MRLKRLVHNLGCLVVSDAGMTSTSWDVLLEDVRGLGDYLATLRAAGWRIEDRDGKHVHFVRTVKPRRKVQGR